MTPSKSKPFLDRYTSLPTLLDILTRKKITLRSPNSWEDRNDAHYLDRYKAEKALKTLLALCFTTKPSSFPLWKIYAQGTDGVCIRFDKLAIIHSLQDSEGFSSRTVAYWIKDKVVRDSPPVAEWPFLKRRSYVSEGEYRIIYESEDELLSSKDISIDISWISRITLSPWLKEHKDVENAKMRIHRIDGCNDIRIIKSGVIESAAWKKAIDMNSNLTRQVSINRD
jgi:hypothetical protein